MITILYDFDGLLIDSESAGLRSWQRVYGSFGHELDLDYWLAETLADRGSPDWWIEQQLAHCGIDRKQFACVVTKSPALARKTAPDSYLAALSQFGAVACDAVAFEDSLVGMDAAHAAGIKCVAVPNDVTSAFDLTHADLVLPRTDDSGGGPRGAGCQPSWAG